MEQRVTEQFEKSFVRIKAANGAVVGAGFLVVDKEHVLTCAHVVDKALRTRGDTEEKSPETVDLDFPFLGAAALAAQVEQWLPPSGPSTNPSGDIAVLKLQTAPPSEAMPVRLATAGYANARKFRAHGYPLGHAAGVWAYGVLRDRLGNGWLQVEDTKGPGRGIERGFSGGPVQDQETGCIVGMVVAATRGREEKVGFVIPTEVLAGAYPQIEVEELSNHAEPPYPVIIGAHALQIGLLHRLSSHRGNVNSVAFCPLDGRFLFSGGGGGIVSAGDNSIRLWDAYSATLVKTLASKSGPVSCLAFSPSTNLFVSGHEWGEGGFWTYFGDGDAARIGGSGGVGDAAFSSDGAMLAVGSDSASLVQYVAYVTILNVDADPEQGRIDINDDGMWGKKMRKPPTLRDTSIKVALSPDMERLATCGFGRAVQLRRVSDGRLVHQLHHKYVIPTLTGAITGSTAATSVAFSPDGRLLASAGTDYLVRLWRVTDGTLIRDLKHPGEVYSVAFSPHGDLVVSGGDDKMVRLWRTDNGALVRSLEGHTGRVKSVAFSPDGRLIASGGADKMVLLWGISHS